ncbi:MAG TPA: hypothetical protein VHH73_11535, partial [Verrucomicrobiae bacterium]|nr:hypothetical protein [Verrucomicrobiae bacterium]
LKSNALQLPEGFFGYWLDLNWIGSQGPSAVPGYSFFWFWLTGAVGFAKTYAFASTFIMGLCGAFCFGRMGFGPAVCVLGGLASALNMNSLSNAAWGLGSRSFVFATSFLAVAALYSHRRKPHWAKIPLAGLAVGLGIVDGYDVGAIFSLYIAAFGLFLALTEADSPVKNFARGALRVAVVAGFAAFIAAAALITLVETQVKGVATQADSTPPEVKWQFATQWSLPKIETLRILVPGLYGYGMPGMYGIPYDEYGRLTYWGNVGASDGNPISRLSGAGEYAGMLVLLIAAFALAQAMRGEKGAFDAFERKCIWFWAGAAVISLLLAFGRYAPFYQVIYHLPFFNNVRNPIKFTHPMQLSILMLFGHGLQVIYRKYLSGPAPRLSGIREQVGAWWKTAPAFESKWTMGSGLAAGAMLVAFLIYNSSRTSLVAHLKSVMQQGYPDNILEQMAKFSINDVGLSALLLALAVALLTVILSGALAGRRAKWAGVLMGVFIALDLGHANAPWIIHFNYLDKYATNPVVDILKERPFERRVTCPTLRLGPAFDQFYQQVYFLPWLQHLFPYYNIQSLDVSQDPRPGTDKGAFMEVFRPLVQAVDITDLPALAARFKAPPDEVTKYLAAGLAAETRRVLEQYKGAGDDPRPLRHALAEDLSRQFRASLLYDPARFAGVNVSPEATNMLQMLQTHPEQVDVAHLNRVLLGDAFPGQIAHDINLGALLGRYWELTNTRMLIAIPAAVAGLNAQMDPARKSFRLVRPFGLAQASAKAPVTAVETKDGPLALVEYGAALPRVSLYSRWEVETNEGFTLDRLGDLAWDPHQTVMVATNLPASSANAAANAGTIAFTSYAPKRIELSAKVLTPSVMLLNDRYAPDWHAWVDGQPTGVFRCNYIMQGLYLTPGDHKIELRFEPKAKGLSVSVAAYVVGVLLCGLVMVTGKGEPSAPSPQTAEPKPVEPKTTEPNPTEPRVAGSSGKDKKRK